MQRLYIKNYALIDELEIRFSGHFTIITGETGAGKSILLGALGLVAGNRADTQVLQDSEAKCVVEGEFVIKGLNLQAFFEEQDLDYDDTCLIRREILPNGKSRAFVNDTPVNISVLKAIGEKLIDIHSQHETLLLKDSLFQLDVVDAYAGTQSALRSYRVAFTGYRSSLRELARLKEEESRMKSELDFFRFQFDELEKAALRPNEKEELETELNKITHAEELKSALSQALGEMESDESGLVSRLVMIRNLLSKVAGISPGLASLSDRVQAAHIEMKDIASTLEEQAEQAEFDPQRQREVEERLDIIYTLEKKHRVHGTAELLRMKDEFETKIQEAGSVDEAIFRLESGIQLELGKLQSLADELHREREKAAAPLQKDILATLRVLGMPDASVEIRPELKADFGDYGKDEIRFLFSANKGVPPQELGKIASGGEISRFMLAVKAITSERKNLPTIIFDEIDTGVSGNIADKLGVVLRKMGAHQQVIAITHLPQIASKGDEHWKVAKKEKKGKVVSAIVQLTSEQRVQELAMMLSGEEVTREAMENARVLLGM